MGPTASTLLLPAAVTHAVWNLAAEGVRGDPVVFVWWYVLGSAVLRVPLAAAGVLAGDARPRWTWLGAAAVSAVVHVVHALVAVALLGEELRPAGVAGLLLLVVAGVVVVAAPGRTPAGGARARGRTRRGVLRGVLTGAAVAACTLWDDHAVTALAVPPLPCFAGGLLVQLVLLTPRVLARRAAVVPVLRTDARAVVVVSVLSPPAHVLVLEAMRTTPVSLVAPVRESSVVVGALLSWLVLREPHPGRRLLGAGVVLAGVAALVSG